MKQILILMLVLLVISTTFGQYKEDNISYKTISWNQFFEKLKQNPKLTFFDVRTSGERGDTSAYFSSNIGRIKGALQSDYFEFQKYYSEYAKYKKDTIYLYCSHSRRSRRLAKQLADSSFKVVSINEGMSALSLYGNKKYPLKSKYYVTDLKYKLISPLDFAAKLNDKNVQVIDIRPDSIYDGNAQDEFYNSFISVKGVKHIPNHSLNIEIKSLDKNKEILLIDADGELTPAVANTLIEKGFRNVGILFYGLDEARSKLPAKKREFIELKYPSITPSELLGMVKKNNTQIIDIRTEAEFNNIDSVAWKNVGRLKNAINIPLNKLTKESLEPYKTKKIVIYDIMMHSELYDAAKLLKKYGIDFYLLAGGISLMKWEIANEGKTELDILIDDKLSN